MNQVSARGQITGAYSGFCQGGLYFFLTRRGPAPCAA